MAERVLNAGAEVVEARVRSNLAGVTGRGTKVESRSTGQLLSALGTSGVKLDRKAHNVKVRLCRSLVVTVTATPRSPTSSNTDGTGNQGKTVLETCEIGVQVCRNRGDEAKT